jgi:transposase-like protein
MKCPYCNHFKTYLLNTTQRKCAKCSKKFSPKKILREQNIIECFCNNYTAKRCSDKLNLNYLTVKNRYEVFRKLIINFLEDQYQGQHSSEYDEYVYLPKAKKKISKNIFDAQNFLTFCFHDTKVYNLLMPNLHKYKQELMEDQLDEVYFKEFSKFMMYNKIAKINKKQNRITQFWEYFESHIVIYKGINNANFIYYLKEFEFKFNYKLQDRVQILKSLSQK